MLGYESQPPHLDSKLESGQMMKHLARPVFLLIDQYLPKLAFGLLPSGEVYGCQTSQAALEE